MNEQAQNLLSGIKMAAALEMFLRENGAINYERMEIPPHIHRQVSWPIPVQIAHGYGISSPWPDFDNAPVEVYRMTVYHRELAPGGPYEFAVYDMRFSILHRAKMLFWAECPPQLKVFATRLDRPRKLGRARQR